MYPRLALNVYVDKNDFEILYSFCLGLKARFTICASMPVLCGGGDRVQGFVDVRIVLSQLCYSPSLSRCHIKPLHFHHQPSVSLLETWQHLNLGPLNLS